MIKSSLQFTRSTTSFILHFANEQRNSFLFQGILCFFWSIKEALFPFFIKIILDNAYQHRQGLYDLFYPICGLAIVWILMEVAMRIQGIMSVAALPHFRASIRKYCFHYFQMQHYEQFLTSPVGEYIDQIIQLPTSCQTVLEISLLHMISIIGALGINMILLSTVNFVFPALLFSWLTLHLLLAYLLNPKISHFGVEHANAVTALAGSINDVFHGFSSIKWFARQQYEQNRFDDQQKIEFDKARQSQMMIEKMRIYQSSLAVIYMITMLSFVVYFWRHQLISLGDFTLIPMLSFSALGMVWWLTQQLNVLYRETHRIRSVLKFMSTHPPYYPITQSTISPTHIAVPNIYCNNISVYFNNKHILKNIDLDIPIRSHVGITGLSGSGKTTFLKALSGLISVSSGRIHIGHYPIEELNQESCSKLMAIVPQESQLFNRTVFENICYGSLSATKEQVVNVAKKALCHDFIQSLPHAYDTILGEGGVNLSLGQKQRLTIARALLTNAPIIIFDEPTASLDSLTESMLLNNLKDTLNEKTVIIISHRVTTLSITNRIVVFDNGRVVEDDTPHNLLAYKSLFYKLCQQQNFQCSFEKTL